MSVQPKVQTNRGKSSSATIAARVGESSSAIIAARVGESSSAAVAVRAVKSSSAGVAANGVESSSAAVASHDGISEILVLNYAGFKHQYQHLGPGPAVQRQYQHKKSKC